jgi:SAM-dependent methyltransferase
MGEIFSRPTPAFPLPFTGERLTSDLTGQTQIEHLHRYFLARDFCREKRALDVASGEGYGAVLLAQVATRVTGVDIAHDAVAHAAASYQRPNLRFIQCDARAMAIADQSVDVAVSFETIEHFTSQEKFLAEIRRVLRPEGLFLVSTPDRDNYSPADTPANRFHALELTRDEFVSLLSRYFTHVACLLQRPMIGSVMLPASRASADAVPLCFEKRGNDHFERSAGLARPQYVIAVASNRPIETVAASFYIETSRLGYLKPFPDSPATDARLGETRHEPEVELARRATELEGLHQQLEAQRAKAEARLAELTMELERQRAECAVLERTNERAEQACAFVRQQLEAERNRATTELGGLREQLEAERDHTATEIGGFRDQLAECHRKLVDCQERARQKEQEVALLHSSNSWRMTAPLRAISRAIKPKQSR